MALSKEKVSPRTAKKAPSPIEYATENGFSIIRLSELNALAMDTASGCHFLVRNPRGWEREVTVHFDDNLIAQIERERKTRLSETSPFWLNCAERCLATYLWERDGYPPGGQLTISELFVDELLLAKHWRDNQGD